MWFWVVALILAGCQNATVGTGGSSCSGIGSCLNAGTGGGTGSDIGTGGAESPFSLTLRSYWERDTNRANPTTYNYPNHTLSDHFYLKQMSGDMPSKSLTDPCLIPKGTAPALPGSTSVAMQTCEIDIPETQLAFSNLEFQVNMPANHRCDVIYFEPYYYLASRSAGYFPPWATSPIDCLTLTNGFPNKSCYAGHAVDMFPSFPSIVREYNTVSNKSVPFSKTWSIKSSSNFYGMTFGEANKWTSFNPISYTIDHDEARNNVGMPLTWNFMCVEKGTTLSYQYNVRIFPEKDTPFNPGAPQKYGWYDDYFSENPNPIGQAPAFSFTPVKGPIDGGTILYFDQDLLSSDAVYFGSQGPLSKNFCQINSAPDLPPQCTTPRGPASGAQGVSLSAQNAVPTVSATQFTYMALSLTSISPATGITAGGDVVTISGEGIARNSTVTIGGAACNVADSTTDIANDGSSLICTTPAKAAGTYSVIVKNPTTKQMQTLTNAFAYLGPTISSISPTSGPADGGGTLTINGSRFLTGLTVTVGGTNCTSPARVSATQATCTLPAKTAGTYNVVLTNSDGESASLTGAFTYQ